MSHKHLPQSVADRLDSGLKKYRPILESARNRDVGEADTVTVIKDMMTEIFGYDKYEDLTSEFSIRGTYVDLAIKMGNTVQCLVEVKAIGCALKDAHVKQAVDYAANQGVDWVILTNGQSWRVYHVVFAKPISSEMIVEVDLCQIKPGSSERDSLYLWCKEGWRKSVLSQFKDQKQALSKFVIGSILITEPVLSIIKKELRRSNPDVRIELNQIAQVISEEVVKREIVENEMFASNEKLLVPVAPASTENDATSEGQRRKKIDLLEIGLSKGDVLTFVKDAHVVAEVCGSRKVIMDGEELSLTSASQQAFKKLDLPLVGTSATMLWMFNGKTLEELRLSHATQPPLLPLADFSAPSDPTPANPDED